MFDTDFFNLHNHDAFGSLLDAIQTPKQIVQFAKEHNQSAIAITNHGLMCSYIDFVKECTKNDIKPITGCEIYEVDDMTFKSSTKDNKENRYHLVLLAINQQGLQNLIKIVSLGCTDGFYVKPRIDIQTIQRNDWGKGIVCLTACQAGRVSRQLCNGDESRTLDFVKLLDLVFEKVFIEIQSHFTESQVYCNNLIVNFARKYNYPLVVTTDSHMTRADQIDAHSIFIEIGEGREVGESYIDCHLQTKNEVINKLRLGGLSDDVIDEAISNTALIVSLVESIDYGIGQPNQMPIIPIPNEFKDSKEYLRYLVFKTFESKFGHMSAEEQAIRRDRIEQELPVLYALDYTDYFIMLWMLVQKADERKIPRGYSRGSGANCLCLFMLGVTQIDSVRWNLDFSRFANLGRRSLADFDFDLSKRRRKEFIEISEELFGKQNVAPIATFNTLSTKVAIKDIGKVLNEKDDSPYKNQIPYSLRDEVAKMIPTIKTLNDLGEEEEKEVLLKDIFKKNKNLLDVYERFPLWFQYVMECEGLPKSMGRHAAGTLITPKPITEYCPICFDKDRNVMCQLEMHNAMDDLSLVKMDFLGLETLDIIDDCLKNAGLTWEDVDINHLDLNDSKVYDNIYKSGNTVGIFQMESNEARKMCIEAEADNIEDIIAINASNRPATKDSFPEYCKNKAYPEDAIVLHEDLKQILGDTYFILLYQEQALQLFRYANFPEEEVDNARRAIGKKQKDKMEKLEIQFKENLLNDKNWIQEQVDALWTLVLKQSTYSFNRGHSVAYGLLSYLTAYLKIHFPKEFMAACLTSKSDKIEKISIYINECKRMGIEVLPPHINKSNIQFTPIKDSNQILFGLMAIKGLGDNVIQNIINGRPYSSVNQLYETINDKSAVIILIKSGAIPTKNKVKTLQKFAISLFEKRVFKPVSTLPTYQTLLMSWNLNVNDYKYNDGTSKKDKVDKEKLLNDYNSIKKSQFELREKQRYLKYMDEFRNKYALNPEMWEFETLSMFLTYDPLAQWTKKYISSDWLEIKNGSKATILAVIVSIERKKDKNGNVFCYTDLYTSYGIIEGIIWASTYSKCIDCIKKGNAVAINGKKDSGQINIVDMMPVQEWAKTRKILL